MSINGSGISEIIIIPHRIQDLFSGKSDSLILQEISQKLKFPWSSDPSVYHLPLPDALPCQWQSHLLKVSHPGCSVPFFEEWLLHVLQGSWGWRVLEIYSSTPEFKSQKLITLISSCCQHNDGNLGIFADLTTYFPAIHLRHHHIQDQKRNILFFIKNYPWPPHRHLLPIPGNSFRWENPLPVFSFCSRHLLQEFFKCIHSIFLRFSVAVPDSCWQPEMLCIIPLYKKLSFYFRFILKRIFPFRFATAHNISQVCVVCVNVISFFSIFIRKKWRTL